MIYSNLYTNRKKNIPTFAALIIILIVVFIISRLFLNTPISSRANPTITNSLALTNLNSNQAAIFFKSSKKEIAWILYGLKPDNLDRVAQDTRDGSAGKQARYTHYGVLKDLQPKTIYYYKIISGGALFATSDGSAFSFTTLSQEQQTSSLRPAYGKVVNKSGDALDGAVVLLLVDNIIPLSTTTKSGGDFVIPLTQIFDSKSRQLRVLSNNDQIKIEVFDESNSKATIRTNILNLNPIPEVIKIGQTYTFLQNENVLSASSSQASSSSESNSNEYGILFPKENALIPAQSPLIKGRAYPGSEVKLTLQTRRGNIQSQFVKVDSGGNWRLLLTSKLNPDAYALIFSGKDGQGKVLNQKRNFSITKSGESVLGVATPEASPTIEPTTLPTGSPTTSPSTTISPEPTITLFPTSQAASASPTIIPIPPATGDTTIQTVISSTALILGGVGLLLFAF